MVGVARGEPYRCDGPLRVAALPELEASLAREEARRYRSYL
jgi:hypothetical protein